MMFCNIQTSDSPFVLMRACQLLEDSAKLFGRWFGLSPFAGGGAERILAGAGRCAGGYFLKTCVTCTGSTAVIRNSDAEQR